MNLDAGMTGYTPRDYQDVPEFSVFDSVESFHKPIPRSEWWELYRLNNEAKSSPADRHRRSCKILNQGSFPFCWAYSAGNAVMNVQAMSLDNPRLLNPHSTACWRTNYKKRGGYGAEACKAVSDFGVASYETWPKYSMDRKLRSDGFVKADAAKNKLTEFKELPRESVVDYLVSMILLGYPVVVCFNWWRHAVLGVDVRFKDKQATLDGNYDLLVANSWGTRWEDKGYGWLSKSKAKPDEALVCVDVKVRS
jgi:hypothetical protein